MTIGFIGLGAMGSALAERLLAAGYPLTVFNRTPARCLPLVQKGAKAANTPAECAKSSEILFTMVKDDVSLQNLLEGEDGIYAGLPQQSTHVCCSTISTQLAETLQQRHTKLQQYFFAAPVLGRPLAAQTGQLYILAAGPEILKNKLRPLFEVLGQKTFNLGENPTQASIVKLSLNFLILSTIEQMAEVFTVTEKIGLTNQQVLDILTESFFGSPVYKNYGQFIVDKIYFQPDSSKPDSSKTDPKPVQADVDLLYKDISLFLSAGQNLQTPLPLASLIQNRLLSCIALGHGQKDFTIMAECARTDAGLSSPTSSSLED
ncbi:NAD(P)-dependent oxidoreductase [Entomobacter blattae]|uniref:3-hydroxyisobutyrate dehydrogenase n=1 Tax=Entomobacter blattae TaxID=2762277 RepID=A0A7H1NNX4_9PROT|nr:NAD(P)-dependent oxidoreductase [Entomobacter blattae]QNT77484.1 3-hydroxyisobutyrate dehydrogenase [Entomobacter blattae]